MSNRLKSFYLFMFDVKTTGSMYFVAFVFFYLVFGAIKPSITTTLDFWTVIEIFAACLLIGFGQGFILYKKDLSRHRILLWEAWSIIVTIVFSEGFGWFKVYPTWYKLVFYIFISISFSLMLIAFRLRLQKETKKLNQALYNFKENNKMSV